LRALSPNGRGIAAMFLSMAFFIGNDTLLKIAAATHPPSQVMALRGLFATAFAFCIVLALGQLSRVGGVLSRPVLVRAFVEGLVAFLFITALARLPLANITAILQSTPIIMTAAAVALGIERVGWRRWTATIVGFVGVLVIVQPTPAGFNVYALVAIGAAILVAVRDLVTRLVGIDIPSPVVALSTTAAVGLSGLILGLGQTWQPITAHGTFVLFCAALLVTIGNLMIIVAFRGTDISVVGPFRYAVVPMAILVGFLVFGEVPEVLAWLGIALVVGSGLYMIRREHVVRRARAVPAREPA
jgi:drug/metabolite transporter (DMT)-like permease